MSDKPIVSDLQARYSTLMSWLDDVTLRPRMSPVLKGLTEDGVRLIERTSAAEAKLAALQAIVDEQAEDHSLWFTLDNPLESPQLQRALRRLHAAIEGKTPDQCALEALDRIAKHRGSQ
jgi:hypothetical protein